MSFITDKQTLDDLNILGKYKSNSIYKLFNHVQTAGGEKLLEKIFEHPLNNNIEINNRTAIFRYFQRKKIPFPFNNEQLERTESYLSMAIKGGLLSTGLQLSKKKALKYIRLDKEYTYVQNRLYETITLLKQIYEFFSKLQKEDPVNPFIDRIIQVSNTCQHPKLNWLANLTQKELPLLKLIWYDHLLRQVFQAEIRKLLYIVYELDVFITVSNIALQNNFCFALALPKDANTIKMTDIRHSGLKNAIANSVNIDRDKNVIFLTGANMAGKSTFMKSFGVAIYLSHMGFPVAAQKMTFSVQDGIYTSINVPDNLNAGYSHFYAEVLRVKKVAEQVAHSKNLIVIFDELFKGTNVKDAYEATVAVTKGFSAHRNCSYIISTHIIEAAEELKKCDNFQFVYFPTIMDGSVPKYTYILQPGVTEDRHGKIIIDNERIVEIIEGKNNISKGLKLKPQKGI